MPGDTTSTEATLFSAAMVVVNHDGIMLVRLRPQPPWQVRQPNAPLDLSGLRFLAELRRCGAVGLVPLVPQGGADGIGADAAAALVETLTEFGLLTNGPDPELVALEHLSRVDMPIGDRDPLPEGVLVLTVPVSLRIVPGAFEALDHGGTPMIRLDAEELWAAMSFATPRTAPEAFEDQAARSGGDALDSERFDRLLAKLAQGGLIGLHDPTQIQSITAREEELRRGLRANNAFRRHAGELHSTHDATERARQAADGIRRTKVVPVQVAGNIPPLSTGMVFAYARAFDGGSLADTYDLHPRWITEERDAPDPTGHPVVYLFTNYLWSHERNLEFAKTLKDADPSALTIHGGPDCPTYPGEGEVYLRQNPQVDIAVRGEGEVTASEVLAALAPSMRTGRPDLSALADVPGLTFRNGDDIVRTGDRPRIEDVDTIPSPYLTGVFDAFGDTRQMGMAIIETNRGCPYGCTFCDWGSATNSRIRKFDLDRVLAEFTWCAEHEVPKIFVADANFGIFPRDVEIARHVVALKERYGYPKRFITNYAKNTVKHLKEIVSVLALGGVLSEGLLSLQSMDEETLLTIRRSNIKLDKYEALSKEFRQAQMPLFVDLMMGLPGQTFESLRRDFQQCVDREVNAKCHQTELLVNSPMNEPAYRTEHRLEISRPPGATGQGVAKTAALGPAFVVSSATFTRDDYLEMHLMRRSYLLSENFGVLRQVSRFVRSETGLPEVELIEGMRRAVTAAPEEWPYLALTLNAVPDAMVPPVSWALFVADLRRYLTGALGLSPGSDLETVLTVQHALLPTPRRAFPLEVSLPHDYAAWYRTVISAKDDGHLHDWETVVERLATFPAATMRIADSRDLCSRTLGSGSAIDAYQDWELDSPVARAMPGHYQLA